MPNRLKKRSYPVNQGLPIEKPKGENFFLASVRIDNPDDPCWDDGFSVVGPWRIVSQTVSRFLAFDPRAGRATVQIFQGETARHRMVQGILEEARYQQQKRAQPNN